MAQNGGLYRLCCARCPCSAGGVGGVVVLRPVVGGATVCRGGGRGVRSAHHDGVVNVGGADVGKQVRGVLFMVQSVQRGAAFIVGDGGRFRFRGGDGFGGFGFDVLTFDDGHSLPSGFLNVGGVGFPDCHIGMVGVFAFNVGGVHGVGDVRTPHIFGVLIGDFEVAARGFDGGGFYAVDSEYLHVCHDAGGCGFNDGGVLHVVPYGECERGGLSGAVAALVRFLDGFHDGGGVVGGLDFVGGLRGFCGVLGGAGGDGFAGGGGFAAKRGGLGALAVDPPFGGVAPALGVVGLGFDLGGLGFLVVGLLGTAADGGGDGLGGVRFAVFVGDVDLYGVVVAVAGLLVVKVELDDLVVGGAVKVPDVGLLIEGLIGHALGVAGLLARQGVGIADTPALGGELVQVEVVRHLGVLLLHAAEVGQELPRGDVVTLDFDLKGLRGLHGVLPSCLAASRGGCLFDYVYSIACLHVYVKGFEIFYS